MPWCPKCKNEYKEGITVCVDCGSELVESLEDMEIPLYFGPEEDLDKIINFLNANQVFDVEKRYEEAEDTYELIVKSKDKEEIKKLIRVFLKEMAPKEELESIIPKKKYIEEVYEDTGKRAEEYKSGAYTLLLVGGLGILVMILINLDVIPLSLPLFTRILVTCVMGVLFLVFAFLGFSSLKTCKKLEAQAKKENSKEEEILSWAADTITKEMIDTSILTGQESEEELYFKRIEKMRDMVKEAFPEEPDNFVEYLLEIIYGKVFE